jgi:hypothetical protein
VDPYVPLVVAQQQQTITPLLIWLGVLILVAAVGGALLMAYRRRIFGNESSSQTGLLDDLRAMRDQGQITAEEYDAARKRMAARLAGVAPPPSAAVPPVADPGVRSAKPGFDLTGAPLPSSIRPLRPMRPLAPPPQTPDKPTDPTGPDTSA